jgi:hypothetical protein
MNGVGAETSHRPDVHMALLQDASFLQALGNLVAFGRITFRRYPAAMEDDKCPLHLLTSHTVEVLPCLVNFWTAGTWIQLC